MKPKTYIDTPFFRIGRSIVIRRSILKLPQFYIDTINKYWKIFGVRFSKFGYYMMIRVSKYGI